MNKLKVTGNLPENEISYGIALAESIASKAALEKLAELSSKGMVSDEDSRLLGDVLTERLEVAELSVVELSSTSKIHHQRMESTRMELLMAQMASINEASVNGLLSESIAESATKALLGKLHESQEKKETEEVAKVDTEETIAVSSTLAEKILPNEPEISAETFEQLGPPEVDDLLESDDDLESL
jgi:hypothetical protein